MHSSDSPSESSCLKNSISYTYLSHHVDKTQFPIHITTFMSTISTYLSMTTNQLPNQSFIDACKLAKEGKEYSHLIKFMLPDHFLRLRAFVRDLPESIAKQTHFGKANFIEPVKKKK
jgi:hypothetical protein